MTSTSRHSRDLGSPLPLEGRVAIVTGASRGIGAETARLFSAAGASVALAARDEAALTAVADELSSDGHDAIVIPTDIGDEAAVERLVAKTVDALGRLDWRSTTLPGVVRRRHRSPISPSRPTTAPSRSPFEASSCR
jgi:short chain dehydrogenase